MKNESIHWSSYGKWRQIPFPTISSSNLTQELIEKYELPDLSVFSVEQVAYSRKLGKICVEYPGRNVL